MMHAQKLISALVTWKLRKVAYILVLNTGLVEGKKLNYSVLLLDASWSFLIWGTIYSNIMLALFATS